MSVVRQDNDGNSYGNDEQTAGDTEVDPARSRELDAKRHQALMDDPPRETASVAEQTEYYHDLLLVLHDKDMIIAQYEVAQTRGVSFGPGIVGKVAQAYVERNQEGDKDRARQALDAGREYVKSQTYAAGEGGTDETLSGIDIVQKELGL